MEQHDNIDHRAVLIHNSIVGICPSMGVYVDELFERKGKDLPVWPTWCFLPLHGWDSIAAVASEDATVASGDVLAAIGTWHYSQGIYSVDPDLMSALTFTQPKGDMPSEVLCRLPEWSVYVELPDYAAWHWSGSKMHGFWAVANWNPSNNEQELLFLFDFDDDDDLASLCLPIGSWPIEDSIKRYVMADLRQNLPSEEIDADLVSNFIDMVSSTLEPLVSALLYLCSDEPDIHDVRVSESGARFWTVGEQIGKQLRDRQRHAEDVSASGQMVRTYLRRGHWHGGWREAPDGERAFSYKWVPPLIVNS